MPFHLAVSTEKRSQSNRSSSPFFETLLHLGKLRRAPPESLPAEEILQLCCIRSLFWLGALEHAFGGMAGGVGHYGILSVAAGRIHPEQTAPASMAEFATFAKSGFAKQPAQPGGLGSRKAENVSRI
ncbi:hypothetical protein [Rhizobium lentis]|uniref:Uncharacterized protein n=1 Tax=Rhizobium lentis TaxID=1138194 RepID=A0ABS7I747_9HYPH|nr:hypothetical protein [Rhizobium lentis]MBX5018292.1 hypothetical protein [Rhizobium lentis]MBX5083351.1 hypothetical protein [Rhizobium lentis]MBX5087657.1 hypothetical protein [Rhizobium lentis]MBX5098234.1 hypothetical protein [Rhizobium lentis]